MASARPCVLVHGGWCGGWHWDDVAARLRAPGIARGGADVAGNGGARARSDARNRTARAHRRRRRVDRKGRLRDVVLVGHSYGGAVVTGVAHRCGERIAELVYLDGFVPRHGESLADILGAEFVEASRAAARNAGTPHLIPPMFSVEASVGWTGQRAADHAARMCGQPIATAFDRTHAPGPLVGAPLVHRVYRATAGSVRPIRRRGARLDGVVVLRTAVSARRGAHDAGRGGRHHRNAGNAMSAAERTP